MSFRAEFVGAKGRRTESKNLREITRDSTPQTIAPRYSASLGMTCIKKQIMILSQNNSIQLDAPLKLGSGAMLPEIEIAFNTYGVLNAERSNAVIVLHALTGSPDAHEWWSGLIGPGKLLDPEKYFIIAPNLLGKLRWHDRAGIIPSCHKKAVSRIVPNGNHSRYGAC